MDELIRQRDNKIVFVSDNELVYRCSPVLFFKPVCLCV